MLTEREKMMIDGYLPSPRDKSLAFNEYYVRDKAGRVRHVRITDILCMKDADEYKVAEVGTGRNIDTWHEDVFRGFRMGFLYDNRDDCRDGTHDMYDGWEHLRKRQEEENGTE